MACWDYVSDLAQFCPGGKIRPKCPLYQKKHCPKWMISNKSRANLFTSCSGRRRQLRGRILKWQRVAKPQTPSLPLLAHVTLTVTPSSRSDHIARQFEGGWIFQYSFCKVEQSTHTGNKCLNTVLTSGWSEIFPQQMLGVVCFPAARFLHTLTFTFSCACTDWLQDRNIEI